ncbi:MAG: GldG family protein [Marinifilaceae bacterium]
MQRVTKMTVIVLLCVLLLNITSILLFKRGDFSANQRFSLSKGSKFVIETINKPIIVDVYISNNVPHSYKKLAQEFINMVKEYKSLSSSPFKINVINVDSEEARDIAICEGIKPIHLEFREGDMELIQQIYLGATFQIGARHEVIPEITPHTAIEYEVTKLLKKELNKHKPKVGFVIGHNECSITRMPQFVKELSTLSEISLVKLDNQRQLDTLDVLCIIDPRTRYTYEEIQLLERYLDRGGRMFVALNHAVGQVTENRNNGFINRVGIEDMLERYGLKINYDFVVDNNCGTVSYKQLNNDYFNFQNNVSFPYLPIITNFSNHIITYGLNSILLTYASSIKQIRSTSTYMFTPLATSSAISGIEQAPVFFNIHKNWHKRDFNKPGNIVAALLTNDDNGSAIVTITDADFIINDHGIYEHPLGNDNVNFALNSIEWLSDNSGLIELRNKFTTIPLLKTTDTIQRRSIKYANFAFPLVIVFGIALIRLQKQRRKRDYRSRPGYID